MAGAITSILGLMFQALFLMVKLTFTALYLAAKVAWELIEHLAHKRHPRRRHG